MSTPVPSHSANSPLPGLKGSRWAFVNGEAQWGGAEKVFYQSVLACQKAGAEVTVLLFANGPLVTALRDKGVEVSVLPLTPGLASWGRGVPPILAWPGLLRDGWGMTGRIRAWMRAQAPDFVLSNSLKTHLLLGASRLPSPIVWHLHDMAPAGFTAQLLRRVSPPVEALANSQLTLESWVSQGLIGRGEVLYNGVPDLGTLPFGKRKNAKALHVGLVATYARWKGHERFLDAIARLEPNPEVRYSIIGGPIYRTSGSQWTEEELKQMIESRGLGDQVSLVGFQEQMSAVYPTLDVVVHASEQSEPFGMVIAEALRAGIPCIASKPAGCVEILGDAVLEAEPGVDGLVAALRQLLSDEGLRKKLGERGRQASRTVLSLKRFQSDWEDLGGAVVARWKGMRTQSATLRYAVGFRKDMRLSMENFGWGLARGVSGAPSLFFPEGRGEPGAVGRRWLYPRKLEALGGGDLLHLVDHSYADALAQVEGQYRSVCVTLHDLAFWKTRNPKNLWVRKRILENLKRCQGVVAISPETAAEARELGISVRRIIPPGFFTRTLPHSDDPREPGRLLHVGGTGERKGMDRLLALLAGLPSHTHLVQVGDSLTPLQWEQARELGVADRIREVGRVAPLKLYLLYRSAAVVLVPSRYEGFGMPVVEARLVGTPVLGDKGVPALAALASDPGVMAHDWTEAPSPAVKQFLENPKVSPLAAREEWDWSRRVEEYQQLYEELLSESEPLRRSA